MWNWLGVLLKRKGYYTDKERYCEDCGVDLIGNDPHTPDCQITIEEVADNRYTPSCFKCSEMWFEYYRTDNTQGDRNKVYSRIRQHQAGSVCTRDVTDARIKVA